MRLETGHATLLFVTFALQHLACFSSILNVGVNLMSFCRGADFRVVDDNDIRGRHGFSYGYSNHRRIG